MKLCIMSIKKHINRINQAVAILQQPFLKKHINRINQAVAILQQPFFEQIYYKFTPYEQVNQNLLILCYYAKHMRYR